MIDANETFDGTFPFAPRFSTVNGFKMHYVDEGRGEPILCLHGEPTWGYLYRKFVPPLSRSHRVVVPDHMGFGKSETPQDREYTLSTHVENLVGLVDELGLQHITIVAQDWGGPIAGAFAVRHPHRVKRLFLMNTVLGYGRARPAGLSPWFEWVKRHYEDGTYEQIMGNLGSTILSVMTTIGLSNLGHVDDTWIRAYSAPFPNRQSCRGAVAFPLDILLGQARSYIIGGFDGVAALKTKPAMLAMGMRDRAFTPEYAIADFRGIFGDAPVVEIPGASHFCQEDAPEVLIPLVQQFLQSS